MITLRNYQIPLAEQLPALIRQGKRRILVQMPTGAGKTKFAAHFAERAQAKGNIVHFLVHRRELIRQTVLAMADAGVHCGVIAAGFPEHPEAQVQVCSIGSLPRRIQRLPTPHLVIPDEVHHAPAKSWSDLLNYYTAAGAVTVGLSATPWRMNGQGLHLWFDHMICGPSTADLITTGWLSRYKLFAPGNLSMKGVHINKGDYDKQELNERLKASTVVGDALTHYQRYVPGKRALIFAWSIESSIDIAERFNAAGIPAIHIDGTTSDHVRDAAIKAFMAGDILVLTNVNIATEGLDIPGIEALFMLRPTKSLVMYLQAIGRALRIAEGKDQCWIFDHARNCYEHGLPDDEREWTLLGEPKSQKKDKDTEPKVKKCPQCSQISSQPTRVCPGCGFEFLVQSRVVDHKDGELNEVDAEAIKAQRRAQERQAKTVEELTEIGRQRGYKHPALWAKHHLRARKEKAEFWQRKRRGLPETEQLEMDERWRF